MSDEELRAIYADALAARSTGARTGCPAAERLARASAGEGPEAGRLEVIDHAMGCAECRREFELFRALAAGRPPSARWVPVALAAAALLVVALGLGLLGRGPRGTDPLRGGSAGLSLIGPGPSAGAGVPLSFTWHPVADAQGYRLTITTADGQVQRLHETSDTFVVIGAGLGVGEFRWWVTLRRQDGSEVAGDPRALRITQ